MCVCVCVCASTCIYHIIQCSIKYISIFFYLKKFPKGYYCVWSNGRCPSGFYKRTGGLRGIVMYSKDYVDSGNFGDSKISCHDNCRSQYYKSYGDLYLSVCCK